MFRKLRRDYQLQVYIEEMEEIEETLKEIDYQLANYEFKKNEINNKDLFVVTFRSKPIKGIVLELQTINQNNIKYQYKGE